MKEGFDQVSLPDGSTRFGFEYVLLANDLESLVVTVHCHLREKSVRGGDFLPAETVVFSRSEIYRYLMVKAAGMTSSEFLSWISLTEGIIDKEEIVALAQKINGYFVDLLTVSVSGIRRARVNLN